MVFIQKKKVSAAYQNTANQTNPFTRKNKNTATLNFFSDDFIFFMYNLCYLIYTNNFIMSIRNMNQLHILAMLHFFYCAYPIIGTTVIRNTSSCANDLCPRNVYFYLVCFLYRFAALSN